MKEYFCGGGDVGLLAAIESTSALTVDAVTWSGIREVREQGFGGDPHGRWMVLWELILEAENATTTKIASETLDAVDLPCLSSTMPGLILRGTNGQERIMQDHFSRKGANNLQSDFFV